VCYLACVPSGVLVVGAMLSMSSVWLVGGCGREGTGFVSVRREASQEREDADGQRRAEASGRGKASRRYFAVVVCCHPSIHSSICRVSLCFASLLASGAGGESSVFVRRESARRLEARARLRDRSTLDEERMRRSW